MTYDVIIAGAGPAGSTAAKELASRGRNVLVLERSRHPRRKVCGGCLSSRIDKLLGTGFHEVVERTVREVVFAYGSERYFYHKAPSPFAYLVQRERFDKHLAEAALRAGANIRENEQIIEAAESVDGVRVTTAKGKYEAAYLIGADGVSSIVARCLGLTGGRHLGFAREADIELPMGADSKDGGILTIGFGDMPFGYGWVFPKEGSASVGVAGKPQHAGDIKRAFSQFLARQGRFSEEKKISPSGYYLASINGDRTPIHGIRSLLAGDAAGFADPLLGEGIYYSILSGQIAAQVIHQALGDSTGDLNVYPHLLKEGVFEEFHAAGQIAKIFHRFQGAGFYVLENGDIIEGFCNVLRGKSSYREQLGKLKSIVGLEILRYLGVLRPTRRGVPASTNRPSFLGRHLRSAAKGMIGRHVMAGLREYIRDRVPVNGIVLNVNCQMLDTHRLVSEESNPSQIIDLTSNPTGDVLLSQRNGELRLPRVRGDISWLPFRDGCFDAVICAEGIEKLRNPRIPVREFLRVIRPGGAVIYAFLALPETGGSRLLSYLLEHMARWPFLPSTDQPFHRCGVSRLRHLAGGMIKIAVLGKCCNVEELISPCLPSGADPKYLHFSSAQSEAR